MSGLIDSVYYLISPTPLLFMAMGTFLGIAVGAIPGLTGAMVIALILPLTFYMDNLLSIVLLISIYTGAVSGGLISAILLRIPGTPASVMTTFDGYAMARGGRPGRALGLGITASFIGGMVGWLCLATLSSSAGQGGLEVRPLRVLHDGADGRVVLIAAASQGSMMKGLLAGVLGMLLSMPGVDHSAGMETLDLRDFPALVDGFSLMPVLIGIFAVGQTLSPTFSTSTRSVSGSSSTRRGCSCRCGNGSRSGSI